MNDDSRTLWLNSVNAESVDIRLRPTPVHVPMFRQFGCYDVNPPHRSQQFDERNFATSAFRANLAPDTKIAWERDTGETGRLRGPLKWTGVIGANPA